MAEREALYGLPTLASARAEFVIANGGAGGVTVTVAAARRVPSVVLVAVIETGVLLLTCGAVKVPLFEMLPAVADQLTAVSEVPVILALNC